jgi:muramoyltetrapeptide carboxypeptidase
MILAPAGPIDRENLAIGKSFLESMGFEPIEAPHLHEKSGYLAGTDTMRAQDLNQAFLDADIRGIFCARGGYGTLRILPLLKTRAIQYDPKPLIGFSDNTVLAMFLFRKCGLVTFSGPSPAGTQINDMTDEQKSHYADLLKNPQYLGVVPGRGVCLVKGESQGALLGGNLTLLVHLAAADCLPDLSDSILLIEDVNEPLYKIDRAITALLLSGRLQNIQGVLAGEFTGVAQNAVDELLLDRFGPMNIPIVSGFPIGHGKHNIALPIGVAVRLDANHGRLELLQASIR